MGSPSGELPSIEIFSHVDSFPERDCKTLRDWTIRALPPCLDSPGRGQRDLPGLDVVEISVVSDEVIAAVHAEFLDDPSATDVITFPHGEILISHDTARRCAREHGHSLSGELFLYIVHGLLHLNGHLDGDDSDRELMHRIQDQIWMEAMEEE